MERVVHVVRRLLKERSVDEAVGPDDDLREAGLTSLDMVNLMLSIEAEFDLEIPDAHIIPANFRSISTISSLMSTLMNDT
jgi:acyl carrier protein